MLMRIKRPDLLIGLFGGLIIVVIWTATTTAIRKEERDASELAVKEAGRLLDTYEAQTLRALNEVHQSLRLASFARRYAGEKGTVVQLQEQNLLLPNLVFTTRLLDNKGKVLSSSRPSASQWAVPADVLSSSDDGPYGLRVSRSYRPYAGSDVMVDVARLVDVNEPQGEIVSISLPASYLVSDYDDAALGRTGVLAVAGLDGLYRAKRQGANVTTGEPVAIAKMLRDSVSAEPTSGVRKDSSRDGVTRYVAARPLFGFPLAVVIGLPEDEFLSTVRAESSRKRVLAGLAVALVAAFTFILSVLTRSLLVMSERQRQASEKHAMQVEFVAYHDSLTGLPNRAQFNRALTARLEEAKRTRSPFALLFLDLDGFKAVNDELGHQAGDVLLTQVARRLKQCVREEDVVARLGGDEFVVLLMQAMDAGHIREVAHRIVAKLGQPYSLDGSTSLITASVGVSVFPEDGADEESIVRAADGAMYAAKASGKNSVCFAERPLAAGSTAGP